jgi:hypothetical protein
MSMSERMMEKTKIKVSFGIDGTDFKNENITELMGIQPTVRWNQGDIVGSRTRKLTYWEVSIDYTETLVLDNQLKLLYESIKDKITILKDLKNKFNCNFFIVIVLKIENKENPSMHLHKWFVDFLHEIGAEVDIDMYIYS